MPNKVSDVLSRAEISELNRKSDWAGLATLAFNWALIAAVLAGVAVWPNPLSVIAALFVLGGRQLGLAVIMHDSGHRALFKSGALNRFVGTWLAAAPIFSDLDRYFGKHTKHHSSAGSDDDPDLENYRHYAVPKDSFRRKILRDLTGRTGVKTLWLSIKAAGLRGFWKPIVANLALLGVLTAVGQPLLYLLWLGAYLTTNMLFSRLRQAAEHAVVPNLFDPDPRQHTRTTLARWWERIFIAPNRVNFHLEHHLMPSVPPHNLPRLHRLLRERGFYDDAEIVYGYQAVIAKLTRAPEHAAQPTSAGA